MKGRVPAPTAPPYGYIVCCTKSKPGAGNNSTPAPELLIKLDTPNPSNEGAEGANCEAGELAYRFLSSACTGGGIAAFCRAAAASNLAFTASGWLVAVPERRQDDVSDVTASHPADS